MGISKTRAHRMNTSSTNNGRKEVIHLPRNKNLLMRPEGIGRRWLRKKDIYIYYIYIYIIYIYIYILIKCVTHLLSPCLPSSANFSPSFERYGTRSDFASVCVSVCVILIISDVQKTVFAKRKLDRAEKFYRYF